jgi:hypothetical protein
MGLDLVLTRDDIAHRGRIPQATPRCFDPPRIQFRRYLVKGRTPCPNLLDHRQHILTMAGINRLTADSRNYLETCIEW